MLDVSKYTWFFNHEVSILFHVICPRGVIFKTFFRAFAQDQVDIGRETVDNLASCLEKIQDFPVPEVKKHVVKNNLRDQMSKLTHVVKINPRVLSGRQFGRFRRPR